VKRVFGVLFLLLVLGGVGLIFYYSGNLSPQGGEEEKVFVINRGESTRSIARRLEKQGLIKDQLSFLIYLRLTGQVGKLQAGSFKLSPSNSVPEIVNILQEGRVDVWVTFFEGQRREEFAQLLNEKFDLPVAEFLKLTEGKEGQLFPDSYLLPTDVVVPQVVKKLVDNFESKWQEVDNQTNLNEKEILILASLVEREVPSEEDRKIVSGILIKRWREGWPLQVDASVQYAKANNQCFLAGNKLKDNCNWWSQVSSGDLKSIDSPYNTYIYKGLPPEPICNPSLSSIKAVINHQSTGYWYYLSDSSGQIHYSKTLDEHNANIRKYLN